MDALSHANLIGAHRLGADELYIDGYGEAVQRLLAGVVPATLR